MTDTTESSSPAATSERDERGLLKPSFLGLLATQGLTALNDNVFRWLGVQFAITAFPEKESGTALALGLACFTLPYLLLSNFAGYLADRFEKRRVIVACKFAEIVVMSLGIAAILSGDVTILFVVVALMGAQSALFAPAKMGAIAEVVPRDALSLANGLVGLVTIVFCAIGFTLGNVLYSSLGSPALSSPNSFGSLLPAVATLLGIAGAGWLTSLFVRTGPAADPNRGGPPNPITETARQLSLLGHSAPLLRTALGIGFFWLLASLAQMTIDPYGKEMLGLEQVGVGLLGGLLVLGVGAGCVIAGVWSGKAVELGIVPLGAATIVVSSIALYFAGGAGSVVWSGTLLVLLGVGAGFFDVPLEAFLQDRAPNDRRGAILAASNFVSFSFMLVASGLFFLLTTTLELDGSTIFLLAGLGTIPVLVYILVLLPETFVRCGFWLFCQLCYRIRLHGKHNVPEEGGALLVANHLTWLDGALLQLVASRPTRMLVYGDFFNAPFVGWLLKLYRCIPVRSDAGPKEMMRSLQTAREAIENGELVCIFAEGQLSRTGQIQPFQRGLLRILKGTDAPVVPVFLDELWGSLFSFDRGKFFWKWPRRWPYPISITYGEPIPTPDSPTVVRQAVLDLGSESVKRRKERTMLPQRRFLRQARASLSRPKVADSSGLELTGGRLLIGTIVFRRVLERTVLKPDDRHIGVLLPPSVGGALVNGALALAKRVSVNLNYTLTDDQIDFCIKKAGIRVVLTSRKFLEKRPIPLDAEVVYVEDLKERATAVDKFMAAFATYLVPSFILERYLGLTTIEPDDLLTIIFTSGSTGQPKGVMLSHHNVISNVDAVEQVLHLDQDDVLLGVLPFFHAFGYTVGLWLTLSLDPKTVYHFNPLDSKTVGKLCEQHGVSLMVATPTFLRSYMKRCTPEQFHRMRLVVVGAEKLPVDVAEQFRDKFGILPTEGYGTTELAPAAALNIPDHEDGMVKQVGTKLGTVGRPLPGVSVKIVDPDTGEDVGTDTDGLLLVTGPNVMQGYLDEPEKTSEVLRDGWYVTGDIARVDEDGFVSITGRQSRFSKIGGEMVPHILVEEALDKAAHDADDEQEGMRIAVTAVPDERKGERLIVVHVPLKQTPDELLTALEAAEIPNLWMPDRRSFVEVESIPLLGSGKLDLKALREIALESTGVAASAT